MPELSELLPNLKSLPELESPEQARFRLFDAITTFLKNLAVQASGLALILDDLHWADKPSLLLLEFLSQELADSRIMIVGTYRDIDLSRQHPLAESLGQLTRAHHFRRLPFIGWRWRGLTGIEKPVYDARTFFELPSKPEAGQSGKSRKTR